jgi:hypothetical protein
MTDLSITQIYNKRHRPATAPPEVFDHLRANRNKPVPGTRLPEFFLLIIKSVEFPVVKTGRNIVCRFFQNLVMQI